MPPSRLIAMENTLFSETSLDWDARCATLAEVGFDGVYAVPYPLSDDDFPRLRRLAVDPARHGLKLAAVYTNIDLALPPQHPVNARVSRLFAEQEGAPRVELSIKCSDPAALPVDLNRAILDRLEPLLGVADRRGFALALYPHSFYPLETPAHAARLTTMLGPERIGYLFPLSHVFAVCSPEQVLTQLRSCAAEIVSVNLCGCRRSAPGLRDRTLALPLDEGDLPLAPFLSVLDDAGYAGDLIVQGHGWTQGIDGLRRSLRTLSARFPSPHPL